MHNYSSRLALALPLFVAALALAPSGARAQASVAPYFLVIVDNSGSMNAATPGAGNNSCGQPRTRISDARCVMQRVVNAYGDINFGLERFRTTDSGTCAGACGGVTCGGCASASLNCSGCADSGAGCPAAGNTADQGEILVPIGAENQASLLSWVNFTCNGNCLTGADRELEARTWTPIAGSLLGARRYFRGMDPTFPASPMAGDPFGTCRPVAVILLTDGEESCASNANTIAAATALHNTPLGALIYDIPTYVIGFGVTTPTPAGSGFFESIAHAGRPSIPAASNAGFYATDETALALAFAQIIEDSVRVEVCDGLDNDCDTRLDEGFTLYCNRFGTPSTTVPTPGICAPPLESVCNMLDDNCDGVVDEGLRNACGTCGPAPTEICNLLDDNCNGAIDEGGVCGGCVITGPEICNNRDDDCNGTIDMITRACGTDVGACVAGTQLCTAGVFGACSGTGPVAEACNNVDDDCDGVIDGMTSPCGIATGECNPGAQVCTAGMLGACIGAIGPTAELCNGLDDNCNGSTDEGNPGGGATCGSAIGICTAGTISCVAGALTCTGGTSGRPETCDTLDEDCDGRVDEGNPGGGAMCGATDVGACEFGSIRCITGALTCAGAVGPATERCNTLDDDCDALVDEGNPEGGASCGDDTGECLRGTRRCIGGTLTCDGSIGPAIETCNGLDDDCDGAVDDGIPVGAACGSDIGECDPGVFACNPATGMLECIGETPPTPEVCDLLDNDCNGMIDDGLPDGAACGTDEGECQAGVLRCVSGSEICVGEITPGTEICDCLDNDCDGTIDEAGATPLCPGTSACIAAACDCASACVDGEFGFECPGGTVPMTVGAACFCVGERCSATTCADQTIDMGGTAACAPGSTTVANCVCRNNACTFSCDGRTCPSGTVCDVRDPMGACVEDSCRGLGCPTGELCDFATGACEADPCLTTTCGATEACRDGSCVASCAGVSCGVGTSCHNGMCETDLCVGSACATGRACDPADGSCVDDRCDPPVSCPLSRVCQPLTGTCAADPCAGLRCPTGEFCVAGECTDDAPLPDAGVPDAGTIRMDAGFDAGGTGPIDENRRILGAGSICTASPGARSGSGSASLLVLALGLVFLRRRDRRARGRSRPEGGAR